MYVSKFHVKKNGKIIDSSVYYNINKNVLGIIWNNKYFET